MQRREDDSAVTEDDINEVKSDISTMRYEMLEIFERNGMDISSADKKEKSHLAKRMKIWERRLMKDFHVAPTTLNEEDDLNENNQSNDRGIERFRRIAHQVVDSTNSHKWTEAVRCVTDTQIGRCRDRESFRNQQNLAKAMTEAKRLVLHSPIQERPLTPVQYNDPTSNTLLELLKDLSAEIDEFYPKDTIRSNKRRNSLTQQLNIILHSKSPSPLPPNILQLAESLTKLENNPQHRQSISSQLSDEIKNLKESLSRAASRPVSQSGSQSASRSASPDIQATNAKIEKRPANSSELGHRRSVTSITSQNVDIIRAVNAKEADIQIQSPPPVIQITRTESDRSTNDTKVHSKGN